MLILSRRPGEAILVGEGIRLVVLECDRGGVRLGIEAPPSVAIVREELLAQVADQNRAASRLAGAAVAQALRPRGRGPAQNPES